MVEESEAPIQAYLSRLDGLIRRGHELHEALVAKGADGPSIMATRAWQEQCGVTIHQLSGGSKAHWLARAFSEAFLKRSASGQAVQEAAPEEIVERLLGVLEKAVASLSQKNGPQTLGRSSEPAPRRFEFVHNRELRPLLEQAYTDGQRALEEGNFDLAMRTSCGILEAIVTDALEGRPTGEQDSGAAARETIADWSFEARLAAAERAGLIGSGCARLPAVARAYRDPAPGGTDRPVSERDARQAGQVLHVVMRDLNPGR